MSTLFGGGEGSEEGGATLYSTLGFGASALLQGSNRASTLFGSVSNDASSPGEADAAQQHQQHHQQDRGESEGADSPLSFGRGSSMSPQEATALRNVTRRSGRRDEKESGRESLLSEGRLLQLESENASLVAEVERLREKVGRLERRSLQTSRSMSLESSRRLTQRRRHLLRDSILHTVEEGESLRVSRDKMSRTASIGTATVLRELPRSSSSIQAGETARVVAERVVAVAKEPLRGDHTAYLCSRRFADDVVRVAEGCALLFESEPRVLRLESPTYVFGDVHGNLEDLHFFSDHIWKLGVSLVAGHLLFLGDYVDRGLSSLEVVAYLFALKLKHPRKVWLLRGNHETRDVNGWKQHYGDRSFLWQCEHRFGEELGGAVWETVNVAFDRLPLAALVDDEIFCVHGGIPRRPVDADPDASRIDLLDCVPPRTTINPPDPACDPSLQHMASECVWSDPALEDQESDLGDDGFGDSLRGGGTICFGHRAIRDFLNETGCAFIMRAHEAHAYGVALSKSATVFTIFSTSKDHHQGVFARAGCVLVDLEAIQVINRSPHYRNRFVHRRDSVSLAGLSPDEIRRRAALGLVVPSDDSDFALGFHDDDQYYDDEEDDPTLDEDDDDFETDERALGPAARKIETNYSFPDDDDDDDGVGG